MVSAAFGTIVYFIIDYISTNKADMMAAGTEGLTIMSNSISTKLSPAEKRKYNINIISSTTSTNAAVSVITAVYVIRKLSAPYSWQIAVGAGIVINLVILIIGTIKFGVNDVFSMAAIIVGDIVSLLFNGKYVPKN